MKKFLWVEQYRPQKIDDCILPANIKKAFKGFVEKGEIPNLLLTGTAGVGKTTIAVQLIRDPGVGAAFKKLLWVSVSQQPDTFGLIRVLYYQLTSKKLPASAEEERDAVQELRQASKGIRVLLVLDDCWDARHGESLHCVDADAGSACVITTRSTIPANSASAPIGQ